MSTTYAFKFRQRHQVHRSFREVTGNLVFVCLQEQGFPNVVMPRSPNGTHGRSET